MKDGNTNKVACDRIQIFGRDVTVSTINRMCSSPEYPYMYAETIVFDNTKTPRKILDMGEDAEGSRDTHDLYCARWSKETVEE